MIAFLGPVQHWRCNKILLQKKLTDRILVLRQAFARGALTNSFVELEQLDEATYRLKKGA